MTFFTIRNLLFVFVLLFFNQLQSQTCPAPVQSNANSGTTTAINATTVIGQSFLACEDGVLKKITVRVDFMGSTPINTELRVSQGNNTSTNRLHTQNLIINGVGDLEITLDTEVTLTAGQTYAFSLGGAGDAFNISFSSSIGDTYTGGTLFQNTTALSTADLFFSLSIILPAPAPPASASPVLLSAVQIPTMSEWGLLIVGLLMLNMGIFFVHRKELI